MVKSQIIRKLETELIEMAIAHINKEALAKKLSKHLTSRIAESFEQLVSDNFSFIDWLQDELTDEKTKAGKAFSLAISEIAQKMAKSI